MCGNPRAECLALAKGWLAIGLPPGGLATALAGCRWLRRSRSDRLETTAAGAGTCSPLIEPVEITAAKAPSDAPDVHETCTANGPETLVH